MRPPLLLLLWWLAGCQKPPPVTPAQAKDAAACKLAVDKAIANSDTCPAAQLRLDSDPACAGFGHLDLNCKEWRK